MNLSIASALKKGENSLRKAGIQNSKKEAAEILENVTKLSTEQVFLLKNKNIGLRGTKNFLKKIKRRKKGEPLQYITRNAYFFSRAFNIMKEVLIPRPETEILVEKILKISLKKKNLSCLDMCTGSGCIGITLALESGNFKKITFADVSLKALKCCKKNITKFKINKRAEIVKSNFFSNIPKKKYDLICSNPPYVTINQYKNLERSVKDYEPKLALISNNEGLEHFEKIAKEARGFLKENGTIFFEVGINQFKSVKNILKNFGYSELVTYNDLSGIKRVVSGKWKS